MKTRNAVFARINIAADPILAAFLFKLSPETISLPSRYVTDARIYIVTYILSIFAILQSV